MKPETLVRHELNGLSVSVEDADNSDLIDIDGWVVRETTNTLVIRGGTGPIGDLERRCRQVPKTGTTFVFTLEDGTRIRVDGDRLVARPARRSETGGVSPWV